MGAFVDIALAFRESPKTHRAIAARASNHFLLLSVHGWYLEGRIIELPTEYRLLKLLMNDVTLLATGERKIGSIPFLFAGQANVLHLLSPLVIN